jgi:hypothetical protein
MSVRALLAPLITEEVQYLRAKNAPYFMNKSEPYYPQSGDPILQDRDLMDTRVRAKIIIDSFDRWVEAKYGPSAMNELRKQDDVFYKVNPDNSLSITDRVAGKEFTIAI